MPSTIDDLNRSLPEFRLKICKRLAEIEIRTTAIEEILVQNLTVTKKSLKEWHEHVTKKNGSHILRAIQEAISQAHEDR
jgi:hypothetical protein